MAIDVGEGLRGSATNGVREIPPIEPLRLGYQRDPNATQFRENLQKCLEEKKAKGAEVLYRVKCSYDRLYNRLGVEPNTVMLSADCVSAVIAECFHEYQVINMKPDKLLGMDVVMTTDKDFVKVCIVDTEG